MSYYALLGDVALGVGAFVTGFALAADLFTGRVRRLKDEVARLTNHQPPRTP